MRWGVRNSVVNDHERLDPPAVLAGADVHAQSFASGLQHKPFERRFARREVQRRATAAVQREALEASLAVVEHAADETFMAVARTAGRAAVVGAWIVRRWLDAAGIDPEATDLVAELPNVAIEHRTPAVARRDRTLDVLQHGEVSYGALQQQGA